MELKPPIIDPFRERRVEHTGLWVFGEACSEGRSAPLFVGLPCSYLAFFGAVSHQAWRVESKQMPEGILVNLVTDRQRLQVLTLSLPAYTLQ